MSSISGKIGNIGRVDDAACICPEAAPSNTGSRATCRELDRIAVAATQLAAVERARDALIRTNAEGRNNPAAHLLKLKGMGPEFASLLWLESSFRSFGNRRQVAAYAGSAPAPGRAAASNGIRGSSKSGNRRLRHTMIELAWFWLRHQPDWALSRWFQARVGAGKGRVAASPSWRWPANSSSPCGAMSHKASFPKAPCSRRHDPMAQPTLTMA